MQAQVKRVQARPISELRSRATHGVFSKFSSQPIKKNTALLTYLVKENNNCVELLRVVEPVRCDLQTSSQSSIDMQLFELQEPLCPDC